MPRIAAFQMDPLHLLNRKGDSTLALMEEAARRGYRLFYYLPLALSFRNGRLTAKGHFVTLNMEQETFYHLEEETTLNLEEADVVWLRQDPPFDMHYLSTTYMLESLHGKTLVLNDPASVRNSPEKWFVNAFPDFLPPTLVSTDSAEIRAFRNEFKDIIIKPLYGYGGKSVFRLKPEDNNLDALLEWIFSLSKEPLVIQPFLPEVAQGDIRVVMADGKVAGQIGRIPAHGEIRSNLRVGGTAARITLTPRQWEICEALEQPLREKGLVFVGIDLIGDYLTEINVTSPTGIRAINALHDIRVETQIWDAAEARMA